MASSYLSSALKYRPATFSEVLAQDHITQTLIHSLERDQIANAFLFAGSRGTGKTTTARILAKALNCESLTQGEPCNRCSSCISINKGIHPDILEIDAASNTGVEHVRELRENARFTPTQGKFKIYIIDECHMLSISANNAFLKTLEEPPSHARFILATTELNKMLSTILSRCQIFRFRRIPSRFIVDRLKHIFSEQGDFSVADPAELERIFFHIARNSEGGLRDALVSLDQLIAFCSGKLNLADVEEILGVIEFDLLNTYVTAIIEHDLKVILETIETINNQGKEIGWFLKECQQFLRNIAVVKISPNHPHIMELPEDYRLQLQKTSQKTSLEQILYITDIFWEAERRMRVSSEARMILEMTSIKAAKAGQAVKINDLLKKISSYTSSTAKASPTLPSGGGAGQVPLPNIQKPAQTSVPLLEPEDSESHVRENRVSGENHDRKIESQKPDEANSTPTAKTSSAPKGTDLFSTSWNQLLHEMPDKFIAGALSESQPIDITGDTLHIAIPSQNSYILRTLEKTHNRRKLEKLVEESFGKSLKIRFETRDELNSQTAEDSPASNSLPAVSRQELMEKVQTDKLFQKITEELPGHIIGIKPSSSSMPKDSSPGN